MGKRTGDIVSPWPEKTLVLFDLTKPTHGMLKAYKRQLRRESAAKDTSHIVREVRVGPLSYWHSNYRHSSYSESYINSFLGRMGDEFDILRRCGIEIPETEYKIVDDEIGRKRVLARVAIVDGLPHDLDYRSFRKVQLTPPSIAKELIEKIADYYGHNRAYCEPLPDVADLTQYLHGQVRASLDEDRDYFVDIEPLT